MLVRARDLAFLLALTLAGVQCAAPSPHSPSDSPAAEAARYRGRDLAYWKARLESDAPDGKFDVALDALTALAERDVAAFEIVRGYRRDADGGLRDAVQRRLDAIARDPQRSAHTRELAVAALFDLARDTDPVLRSEGLRYVLAFDDPALDGEIASTTLAALPGMSAASATWAFTRLLERDAARAGGVPAVRAALRGEGAPLPATAATALTDYAWGIVGLQPDAGDLESARRAARAAVDLSHGQNAFALTSHAYAEWRAGDLDAALVAASAIASAPIADPADQIRVARRVFVLTSRIARDEPRVRARALAIVGALAPDHEKTGGVTSLFATWPSEISSILDECLDALAEITNATPSGSMALAPFCAALLESQESERLFTWAVNMLIAIDESSPEPLPEWRAALATMEPSKLDTADLMNEFAWERSGPEAENLRDPDLARALAESAVRQTRRNVANYLDTLAWAQWRAGLADEALRTGAEALEQAQAEHSRSLESLQASFDDLKQHIAGR